MGQHNRSISFSSSTLITLQVLKEAIQGKFADVLPPGQDFFLQLKNEEWGEFLDLQGDEKIADKSTIKVVMIEVSGLECGHCVPLMLW